MSDQPSIARRPPRLKELASWTSDWREAWGRRANDLEEEGVPWPDHEVRAFDEVKALKAKGGRAPLPPRPKPPTPPKAAATTTTKPGPRGERAGSLNLKPAGATRQ